MRGPDGKPRLSLTVCPSRVIAEVPGAARTVMWWMQSIQWQGGFGVVAPGSAPEWPLPGGLLMQPARLVEAAITLRSEWPFLQLGQEKAPAEAPKRTRKR